MENKIACLTKWLNDNGRFQLSTNVGASENDVSGRNVTLSSGIIRQNELIISVPSACQLNFHTVLYHISKFNSSIRIPNDTERVETNTTRDNKLDPRYRAYGILNLDFLLNMSSFQLLELYILAEWVLLPLWSENQVESFWEPYFAIWPSQDELKSFPAIWRCSKRSKYKDLLNTLPTASRNHMLRISNLIQNDWQTILPILNTWNDIFQPPLSLEDQFEKYLHIYRIINSRCLYTEVPLKKDDILSKFTMVPFVDFLNHTQDIDLHCYPKVNLRDRGSHGLGSFGVYCGSQIYKTVGEEILLNYGPHSNDFLINEYGFVMPNNKWNYIDITPEITTMVENPQIQIFLENNGYWGDYTVNAEGPSYRVIVALSLIVTQDYRRVEKLLMGYMSEDFFLPKINPVLRGILVQLKEKSMKIIYTLEKNTTRDICYQNLANIHHDYIEIIEKNLSKVYT